VGKIEVEEDEADAPPAPSSLFRLGSRATYWEVSTGASFSGAIEICISLGDTSFLDPSALRLLHDDGSGWVDVTTSVYAVSVSVDDGDGGVDGAVHQYIVAYDPSAGFVTGGGWIESPAGACTLISCATATSGPATFGFVSRYQKGATRPSGNTAFEFEAGGLAFESAAYEWLVVAGARAQFKGTGRINGAGDYGFLLTAIDGEVNGGRGGDGFRIKIWDQASGNVVYDNQRGADDDSGATTALGGGSTRIHER